MTPAAFVDPARMGDMASKDTRKGDRHALPKKGVRIEARLWDDAKERAAEDGRTLNDAMVELLRGYVGGRFKIGPRRTDDRHQQDQS